MNGKVFGYMPDGRPVHQYEIRNERMVVRVAELGATLVSCAIDGRDGEHINSPAIARRTAFMAAKSVFTKSYGA